MRRATRTLLGEYMSMRKYARGGNPEFICWKESLRRVSREFICKGFAS